MQDNEDTNKVISTPVNTDNIDENMSLFIYGNIKIRDVETGEILINQRF